MAEPVDRPVAGPADRVLVVVPTYNEATNLAGIVGRVRGAVPGAHLLVVDDASPDGTGQVAEHLASADDGRRPPHRLPPAVVTTRSLSQLPAHVAPTKEAIHR